MKMKIMIGEFLVAITILSLFVIGWLPSKSIGAVAWAELVFLLCSITPILLLGTESSLKFVRRIMGHKYIEWKTFAIMFFVLYGYLIFTKVQYPTLSIKGVTLGVFLHHVALEYLPLTIFLIIPPFWVLSLNNKEIYSPNISIRDVLTLIIIYLFSFCQMLWLSNSVEQFLSYNSLFYLHFIFTVWIFIILPLVLFLVQRQLPHKLIGFFLQVRWKDIKYFLLALPLCILLFILWPSPHRPFSEVNEPSLLILRIVYNIFAIALPAELLYRGLFLNLIGQKLRSTEFSENSTLLAVLISSALFALTHYWNGLGAVLGQFFIGIILAIIFLRTKSLITPVLLHSLLLLVSAGAPIYWK